MKSVVELERIARGLKMSYYRRLSKSYYYGRIKKHKCLQGREHNNRLAVTGWICDHEVFHERSKSLVHEREAKREV